jgi:predicted AAA+ superfamily ATPase
MDQLKLQKQNPWWENPHRIEEDLKIQELNKSTVKWAPRLLKHIDLEKNAVYSIRGPRQVGKTTALKIIIRELLKTKHNANIFYFACDDVKDYIQLGDILETYYDWLRNQNNERTYIFLDEISYVKEWQRAIKHFIDTQGNNNLTMILTGSNILDLKKSTERLPGRVGEKEGVSTNKILLPMKFAEYVELRNPEIYAQVKKWKLHEHSTRNLDFQELLMGKIPKSAWDLSRLSLALDKLLDEYLLTGGIMLAVNEYHNTGRISSQIYDLYLKQIVGDITRAGREEKTAKLILGSIVKRMGTPASWNGIRTENDIASSPTVEQYAYILQDIFVTSICYKLELNGEENHASNKKLYFINSFVYSALYHWLFENTRDPYTVSQENINNPEKKSILIESLVLNHLSRAIYNIRPNDLFDLSDHIYYAKTNKGIEIDFIIKLGNILRGIEVKYQNSINSEDFMGLRKLKQGCMITKNRLEQREGFAVIPASLFLIYI